MATAARRPRGAERRGVRGSLFYEAAPVSASLLVSVPLKVILPKSIPWLWGVSVAAECKTLLNEKVGCIFRNFLRSFHRLSATLVECFLRLGLALRRFPQIPQKNSPFKEEWRILAVSRKY